MVLSVWTFLFLNTAQLPVSFSLSLFLLSFFLSRIQHSFERDDGGQPPAITTRGVRPLQPRQNAQGTQQRETPRRHSICTPRACKELRIEGGRSRCARGGSRACSRESAMPDTHVRAGRTAAVVWPVERNLHFPGTQAGVAGFVGQTVSSWRRRSRSRAGDVGAQPALKGQARGGQRGWPQVCGGQGRQRGGGRPSAGLQGLFPAHSPGACPSRAQGARNRRAQQQGRGGGGGGGAAEAAEAAAAAPCHQRLKCSLRVRKRGRVGAGRVLAAASAACFLPCSLPLPDRSRGEQKYDWDCGLVCCQMCLKWINQPQVGLNADVPLPLVYFPPLPAGGCPEWRVAGGLLRREREGAGSEPLKLGESHSQMPNVCRGRAGAPMPLHARMQIRARTQAHSV